MNSKNLTGYRAWQCEALGLPVPNEVNENAKMIENAMKMKEPGIIGIIVFAFMYKRNE